jgi:hypothetical protein
MELGWGILGYGRISNVFEESFRDINSSKLVAVASNSKILNKAKKRNKAKNKFRLDLFLALYKY